VSPERRVVVLGAGPGGLGAAWELCRLGVAPLVLEQGSQVGGLARTECYRGYRFDLGGHRFFTKAEEVDKVWREVLGPDFLRRRRLSRIYYRGRFFHYPLRPGNVLRGLGPWQSALVAGSYLAWQLRPWPREETFEQWVTNRFGLRLYRTFFATYTEKVWGVPGDALSAEWAAQRIRGLSLRTALLAMLVGNPRGRIRTLSESFDYPRLGPGMMWGAVADEVGRRGGRVRLGARVTRLLRDGRRVTGVVVEGAGGPEVVTATDVVSSLPVPDLVSRLDPPAPEEVLRAASGLRHRDFLVVLLVVNRPHLFPDHWIYVHDPGVRVARIQNFKNWSPDLVPDPGTTSLGLEYFCASGDALWSLPDQALRALAARELEAVGLARADEVVDGCVVRVPRAYPMYEARYRGRLGVVREFVARLENLQSVGRNGLHRYDNQDHAMLTGMLAARNLVLGQAHDLWRVNTEPEYHEALREAAPGAEAAERALDAALERAFRRVDRVALGAAVGVVAGAGLLGLTLGALAWGEHQAAAVLGLLGQYLPGYRVSPGGAALGLLWGGLGGFAAGWSAALARNATLLGWILTAHRRAEWRTLRRLLEHL
jgi:protoporphyrinogen oxidase